MDRRNFLRYLGVAGATGLAVGGGRLEAEPLNLAGAAAGQHTSYLPAIANGSAAGPASILIAAVDAPPEIKKSAHFSCTGVNDQVVIQQVVALLATVGGLIQLSEGTFQIAAAIRLSRRIALVGKGRSTILKAKGSWTAFDGSGPGGVIEPADGGTDKTTVAMLAIDGNRFQGADIQGIYYNISTKDNFDEGPDAAHVFTDLYIYRTRRHGFHLNGSFMRGTKASRIRVYNVGDEGVTEAHGFLQESPDSYFEMCECGSATGSGFYVNGTNCHFVSCKSWYSDLAGWQIRQPRCLFSACEAQDNAQHGFYITTGPNSLVGCHADSNSWEPQSPNKNFDGFHLPWGSRIQLIGCAAYDKNEGGRGNWQRFGFFVGPAAEHCQIMGTVKDNADGSTGGAGISGSTNLVFVNG